MTTVTSPETLYRVDELREVNATSRGLSIEPLWDRITKEQLELTGVNWVIVGGESGRMDIVRPFELVWAEEIREVCNTAGAAFFLKQLGRLPLHEGIPVKLQDNHGGNWQEWPARYRIREFPEWFYRYRVQSWMQSAA